MTANYWDYPTGGNGAPDGVDPYGDLNYEAVFRDGADRGAPTGIKAAGSSASPYGTYGQGGNVREWNESARDGVNDSTSERRTIRGGSWQDGEIALRSSYQNPGPPEFEYYTFGFRVASVPEPTTFALLALGSLALAISRYRR